MVKIPSALRFIAFELFRAAGRIFVPRPWRSRVWGAFVEFRNTVDAAIATSGKSGARFLIRSSTAQFLPSIARHSKSNAGLRILNSEAVTALGNVRIAESLEKGMHGASLNCEDTQLERLIIKEQACYYLAIALLQGLGRLDEAIFWWRERNRVVDAILRIQFADLKVVRESGEAVFDSFWSAHIGHTAVLGIHVKRNILEGNPRSLKLIRAPEPHSGNGCLVGHWKRHFQLFDSAAELGIPAECVPYHAENLFLEKNLAGSQTYYWEAYAQISRSWELAGGGALLELSADEVERGRRALTAMGVPPEAWFVCLHVRAPGFKRSHEELQAMLNADIATYELAIDQIRERGGWVLRMGDRSMPPIRQREGVIDYAHHPGKADWMDIFLLASCRFYLGTSSGPAYVPGLFQVPSVLTNWFPTGTRPLNSADIYIPKLHWYEARGEFAPFSESLAPPLGHIHAIPTLEAMRVSVRNNSADDLRDAVAEMLDRLDGNSRSSDEDAVLQERFNAIARDSRCFGNARIGQRFVRKHRDLLQ